MRTVRIGTRPGGPAVYGLEASPGEPRVAVRRIEVDRIDGLADDTAPAGHGVWSGARREPHAHDVAVLLYLQEGEGVLRTDGQPWTVTPGDLYVVAPGAVVGRMDGAATGLRGWQLVFGADALGAAGAEPAGVAAWAAHPSLVRFTHGAERRADDVLRLRVPEPDRAAWNERFRAVDEELRLRPDGYRDAVAAHLMLLTIGVSRLATDVVGDLRRGREPLLAEVFEVIEERFAGPLSLTDVARAVRLTPGHLTTTVRRRTGHTVQDWILHRRLAEARRLLTASELSVAEVGRRAGFADPGYFARVFGREHGVPPSGWRRSARTDVTRSGRSRAAERAAGGR